MNFQYYHSQQDHGTASLEELITGYTEERFFLNTRLKFAEDIYWKPLSAFREILVELNWDYIKEGVVHKNILGADLLTLLYEEEISTKTQVKLSVNGIWTSLKKSDLLKEETNTTHPFYGFTNTPSTNKQQNSFLIDFLFFYFLLVFGIVELFKIPFFFGTQFKPIIAFLLSILLPACFHTFFVYFFGWTIGTKIFKLNIISSKGNKLSFFQAFGRQLNYLSKHTWFYSWNEIEKYGATLNDIEDGIILTEQKPQ